MIILKTAISTRRGKSLDLEIETKILKVKGKVIFAGLGSRRPVFFSKYLEATNNRRDKIRRKQKFFAALELLRRVKKNDRTNKLKESSGETAFEFKGKTPDGVLVGVHIREISERKDRKLYLISTF